MKIFLARQPMMDMKNEVVGYELLFRNSKVNSANVSDGYIATLKVMKNLIVNFGIKEITNNKRFFINFNDELIIQRAPDLFKPEELVIELLEDTLANEELIDILIDYKNSGYLIALDDFAYSEEKTELLKIADIVKLDFIDFSHEELINIVSKIKPFNVVLLAEKVENLEEFEFAKKIGCTIFQGYYFQKPTIFESSENMTIPAVYYELLEEINHTEIDYTKLSSIIKKDSSLTISLLKLLNSAAYYSSNRVTSVKNALVNLGIKESKKLIMINMLKNLTSVGTPNELINISLRRGKQAEQLAKYYNLKNRADELFIVGLLSLLNVIMKKHMKKILIDVPLESDVIDALLGIENKLSTVLELIILFEMDAIEEVETTIARHDLDIDEFNRIYIESTKWADQIWK
jgi:EAL and modified HD-GYP domain-containing signal transduction protein